MTKVIALANEKGGVAKTTSALSLGGALVEMGFHVLLIDLDPQSNLSLSLGCDPGKSYTSLINLFMEKSKISDAILETKIPNLFILPSNKEIGHAERILPARPNYESYLTNILKELDAKYDLVLIDCPPFLGSITLNALMAANLLVIPTQAEYFSVFALRNMMSLIRHVRANGNPKLRYRLLITLFDKRNRIHRTLAAHLRTTFSKGILDSIIEVDTKLRESPIAGLPITSHASKSRAAMQYRYLAQEIMKHVKE
jgi:chromosome partitioning protein